MHNTVHHANNIGTQNIRGLLNEDIGAEHGGALWFSDLTVADQSLVLPLTAVVLTYTSVTLSFSQAPPGHWLKVCSTT
jgi:hypothetical protein